MKEYVLTGPAGSGKSSTLRALEGMGYLTVPEVAANVVVITDDVNARQNIMLYEQLRKEKLIQQRAGTVIMDRALPDYIAFSKALNADVDRRLFDIADRHKGNYAIVFYLESDGSFEFTDFRIEKTRTEADNLGRLVRDEYTQRGHSVVNVPRVGIVERAKFINSIIKAQH